MLLAFAKPSSMPAGFEFLRCGRDRLVVRHDVRDELGRLLPLFLDLRQIPGAQILPGGRGVTLAAPVRDGLRAVLRRNLRGGLPARFVRDLYLAGRPRPFVEIDVSERLRAAGITVPESLGAIVRRVGVGFYRGAVAMRQVENSSNLWVHLQQTSEVAERRAACAAALGIVRALHGAGAVHPDLNLQNFLVQQIAAAEAKLWLIDCDGVRFTAVTAADWASALERMRRSCRRLDPSGAIVDPAWFDA